MAPDSLERGEVQVEGMLRQPWKKNMFTPDNRPDKGEFYFPDVYQMAELTGSQPVWIEQTMGKLDYSFSRPWAAIMPLSGGLYIRLPSILPPIPPPRREADNTVF